MEKAIDICFSEFESAEKVINLISIHFYDPANHGYLIGIFWIARSILN